MEAVEPSDAERAALPDCTRDYLAHLERENAGLRCDVREAEKAYEEMRALAKANNGLARRYGKEITRLRTAGFRAWQAIWDAMMNKGDLRKAGLQAEAVLADALSPSATLKAADAASVPVGGVANGDPASTRQGWPIPPPRRID